MNLTEHNKVQLAKIKPFTKVKVLSSEHSEYIQKLAFEAGFSWVFGEQTVRNTDAIGLFFEANNKLAYSSCLSYFENDNETYTEIFIDLPSTIKPPFKFENDNLPIVRQWLKDNCFEFEYVSLDIMEGNIEDVFGYVDPEGYFTTGTNHHYFNKQAYPEITFNMCIGSVTFKRNEELENLKSELEKARRVIEEIESRLNSIKE